MLRRSSQKTKKKKKLFKEKIKHQKKKNATAKFGTKITRNRYQMEISRYNSHCYNRFPPKNKIINIFIFNSDLHDYLRELKFEKNKIRNLLCVTVSFEPFVNSFRVTVSPFNFSGDHIQGLSQTLVETFGVFRSKEFFNFFSLFSFGETRS